ncbi:glycosyltransferase family 39 protein [Pendulispora brunnea]|uniref:Glycosyltransferase family 39 protein n=1 Tax=Pendulispora brunnea TaxID=2905690 RepID=A0ABZ2K4V4_9BACT
MNEPKRFSWAKFPESIGWRDHAVGAALFVAYVIWLLITARSLGFPRDESFYFHAGQSYARWFDQLVAHPKAAMERGAIDGAWGYNHEHPSLMKSLFGISWLVLHQKWKIIADASTAFRLPGMATGGLSLWVTYLFGARVYSRRAGLMAAVLLALMPHIFFHAHLACFDMPIAAMWILSVYVYYRSVQEKTLGWALAAGIVYGLTLETKHNAWILPAVFVPHTLVVYGRAFFGDKGEKREKLRLPMELISIAIVGPFVFYALWPWLWSDTANRIREYVEFHVHHEYYNIEYLGKNYFGPPSPPSYAPVMILATVPSITLLLFGLGAGERLAALWKRLREKLLGTSDEPDLLLLLAFAAPLAVFFLPKTPIFGGTKHWMPAYPLLAIFAGRGFDLVADALGRAVSALPGALAKRQRELTWALGALCIAAPLAITVHSHPFGLSAYVPLVGGTAGGADLGLNRQFWGFTTQSVAPYLQANAPRGASVFIHDTTGDAWARMLDEGRMRRDLRATWSPGDAMFSLVQHELHMNEVDHQIWVVYGSTAPAYVLTHDGVPIVSVYRRK